MSADAVAEAVRAGIAAAGVTEAKPFDFIAFDTCLMSGAEVAFPFVDLTDTYIAAAEIDYGAGWNYETTLTYFAANPAAPMADLAVAEVGHWDVHHDRVLELASAAADDTPPVFAHAVSNADAASRVAPPVLQFTSDDPTAAKAAVYVGVETPNNTVLNLGLVGAGLIEPSALNEFAWNGTTLGFADGQVGMVDLWLDVPSGAQPILSISGLLGDGADSYWASLVFGGGDAIARVVVVATGDQPTTVSTDELAVILPGATFTPVYWEYGDAPEPTPVAGNPISVPAEGFELYSLYANSGNYLLLTSVTDIWGNQSSEADAVTLVEALGP